jgi:hypothetical protein
MTEFEHETSMGTVGPSGPDVPDESPVEASTETASHSWRGRVLVLVAVVVLMAGLVLAVTGMRVKADAEDSAEVATASLVTATSDRDTALAQVAHANETAADAASELSVQTATSQRGLAVAQNAAAIADRMCDCNQRMANATKEISAAVVAWDNPRLQRALNEFNAAVDEFNVAYDEYYAAWLDFYDAVWGTDFSV